MASQPNPHHAQRAHPRHKLFQPAEVRTAGGAARVHLLDISPGGARLHAADGLAPGTRVVLHFAGERQSATVAWANGAKCGVRFCFPLRDDQIAAALCAPARPG